MHFDDIEYFPLIFNLSNLDFGQSYIESISQVKIFAAPITPLILHAIFFKFGGLVGLIILEIILQVALLILLFKVIEKVFNSKEISFLFCHKQGFQFPHVFLSAFSSKPSFQ